MYNQQQLGVFHSRRRMRQEGSIKGPSLTKVDDIKHFASIGTNGRKDGSIAASTDSRDGTEMGTVMLDEFDTGCLLLPQLQVSIERSREDKVGSGDE